MKFLTSEKLYGNFYSLYGHLKNKSNNINITISPGQLRFLATINEYESVSQKTLQEEFCVKASSISTVTTKLENEGFLKRERDEKDKRNLIVTITQKGRELVENNYNIQKQLSKDFFDVLSDDEQEELLKLLRKLNEKHK